MKYVTTITVEAEQFDPHKNIPDCVYANGRGNPLTDPRSTYFIKTEEGSSYIEPGDYIITHESGNTSMVKKEIFEKLYVQSSK